MHFTLSCKYVVPCVLTGQCAPCGPSQDALAPADAQEAAAALEADPAAAAAVAPDPAAMPGLVRHNPSLAAQLLLRLADVPQACPAAFIPITRYLVDTAIRLHSCVVATYPAHCVCCNFSHHVPW